MRTRLDDYIDNLERAHAEVVNYGDYVLWDSALERLDAIIQRADDENQGGDSRRLAFLKWIRDDLRPAKPTVGGHAIWVAHTVDLLRALNASHDVTIAGSGYPVLSPKQTTTEPPA